MNPFKADLHIHTNKSDGSLSPKELLDQAASLSLNALSITDHDNIDAYENLNETRLILIQGVEFSSRHNNESVHILGYGFKDKKPIDALSSIHRERRKKRTLSILEALRKNRMNLDPEEVSALAKDTRFLGRPHIAEAMVQRGYVSSVREAFNRYLAEGKSCYVHEKSISAGETIESIHEAGGISVIAHPHLLSSKKALKKLLELPFDGIECFYGNFPRSTAELYIKIAAEKKWIVTGGSDFHGKSKPDIQLGRSYLDKEYFDRFMNRIS